MAFVAVALEMVASVIDCKPGLDGAVGRPCLCCGIPSASRSIPACWDHWNVLPEDLRSFIVISYGRGRTKAYGDGLMEAGRLWRLTGHWRVRAAKTSAAAARPATESASRPQSENRVISLVERRQKTMPGTTSRHSAAEPEERAIRYQPQAGRPR